MADIMRCELISWDEVQRLARVVALQVRASGYRPDLIVAIGRGGCVPARILADYLDMMALTSIRVEHYRRGADKQPEARVVYPLRHDIRGLQVLLVDDVSDSGDTYRVALQHLAEGGPSRVKTVALHHKTVSHYTPDYYAHTVTEWRWLIYPWAVVEDLSGFIARLDTIGLTPTEVGQRLQQYYGIEPSTQQVDDALALLQTK